MRVSINFPFSLTQFPKTFMSLFVFFTWVMTGKVTKINGMRYRKLVNSQQYLFTKLFER